VLVLVIAVCIAPAPLVAATPLPSVKAVPYKKHQVTQWVAEVQRHHHPRPASWGGPGDPIPHPGPGVFKYNGNCRNHLRGWCAHNPCKFEHNLIADVPTHALEASLVRLWQYHFIIIIPFHQFTGTRIPQLAMEVYERYTTDFSSIQILQSSQSQFFDLINGLITKNFGKPSLY